MNGRLTPNRNIIVIGASAGGVEPIRLIVQNLPANLDAAVLVVLDVWPAGPSILPEILSDSGPQTAFHLNYRETLEHGRIYVAPPDDTWWWKTGLYERSTVRKKIGIDRLWIHYSGPRHSRTGIASSEFCYPNRCMTEQSV